MNHLQARREREEQEKMKQDSIKSNQQQQQHSKQSQQEHAIISSQNSHGGHHGGHIGNHAVGGLVGNSHLHHPSLQNDLKMGLGGMGGLGSGNLSMMGQLDNKTNQDLLKAVSKVSS